LRRSIFGRYPQSERNPIKIPTIQTVITIGKFGNFFLEYIKVPSPRRKRIKAGIFVELMCLIGQIQK